MKKIIFAVFLIVVLATVANYITGDDFIQHIYDYVEGSIDDVFNIN